MTRSMLMAVMCCSSFAVAQDSASSDWNPPEGVSFRRADIMSDGTRISAELFAAESTDDKKLPTIIMSHGWGGTAEQLRSDAVRFAQAGYLAVTIDYRGWGNSDSRLVAHGKPDVKDGKLIAVVTEVREVVDPIDQTTDILNAIHWVQGEKRCDINRIGLWGSSFSGGHVVYVAARDPRVKAFVSQVASMDSRWAIQNAEMRERTFKAGTERTRGTIDFPKPGSKFGTLDGAPLLEKLMGYAPIEDIGRCENCAKLFIIAEQEELFDNKEHAILAHDRATGVKKLVTVSGIKHYGIYNEKRNEAQQLAIDWFDEHLKNTGAAKVAAKKKAENESDDLSPLLGVWNLIVETDDGDLDHQLRVTKKNDIFSAIFDAGELGEFSVERLKLKDSKLKFFYSGEIEGDDFDAEFSGRVSDSYVEGEIVLEINNERKKLPATGQRSDD